MWRLTLTILFFSIVPALVLSQTSTAAAVKPSFDCRKAKSDVEQQICGVPEYAALDRDIATMFATGVKTFPPAEATKLKVGQVKWLHSRDACINLVHGVNPVVFADADSCIREKLNERAKALKAALVSGKAPEESGTDDDD